ncbi:hypothetical protein U2P60_01970 [Brucella sp. H1_1004]|mgnify:FL=1|uniref:hypothetical protein n=1 Tax=Brucella sp. H1_1004 TaxID=3110109 RepID=UPI0039B46A35
MLIAHERAFNSSKIITKRHIDLTANEILGAGEAAYLDVWTDLFPDAAGLIGIPPETFMQNGRNPAQIIGGRSKCRMSFRIS